MNYLNMPSSFPLSSEVLDSLKSVPLIRPASTSLMASSCSADDCLYKSNIKVKLGK